MNDNQKRQFNIPLDGRLFTSVDPAQIGKNFRKLQNMRYVGQGTNPRGIPGMEKIGQIEYEVIESSVSPSVSPSEVLTEGVFFVGCGDSFHAVYYPGYGDYEQDVFTWWNQSVLASDGSPIWDIEEENYTNEWTRAWKIHATQDGLFIVGESFRYPDPELEEYTYYDYYPWTIEMRDITTGTIIWKVQNANGYIMDVIAEEDYLYVIGGGQFWTGPTPLAIYCKVTRIEKRNISDGSLVWMQEYYKDTPYIGNNFVELGVDCTLDSLYLYVSGYINWSYPSVDEQHNQSRVYILNKSDGTLSSTYEGIVYDSPYDPYVDCRLAICARDKTSIGLSNIYSIDSFGLRNLDNSYDITFSPSYGFNSQEHFAVSGLAIDTTGIYTGSRINKIGGEEQGYEICKWDFSENLIWDHTSNYGVSGTFSLMLHDLAIDNNNIYCAAHFVGITSKPVAVKQAFSKTDGSELWTIVDDRNWTNWFGVST